MLFKPYLSRIFHAGYKAERLSVAMVTATFWFQ